ncbi:MAG: MFS transporter [Geminicoccaceae bacterium]
MVKIFPNDSLRRARLAIGLVFLVNGTIFGSWAPHIPLVQDRLALGPAVLGAALLAMAVGALCSMLMAGAAIGRFGSAPVTRVTGLLMCAALPLVALAPNLPALIAALACLGAANGMMDVAMNAHGVAVETRLQRPIMSSLHGMFSLGGLLGAGLGALALGWLSPTTHVLAAALGLALVAFLAMRWLLPGRIDVGDAGFHFVQPRGAALGFGALAFLVLMSEGAALDWSAAWLRGDLGASPSVAATAFAGFSAAMAAGRFGGDRLRRRWGAVPLFRASALLAAGGLAFAVLLATPAAAVLGFVGAGLGLSNAVPVLFGAAGRLPDTQPGAGIAATATIGYLGFLAGPPLIGLVAQVTSLSTALGLLVIACGLVGAFASLVRIADDHAMPTAAAPRSSG